MIEGKGLDLIDWDVDPECVVVWRFTQEHQDDGPEEDFLEQLARLNVQEYNRGEITKEESARFARDVQTELMENHVMPRVLERMR